MRQPWMPNTISIALIVFVIAYTIIHIANRLFWNLRRNDRNYNKFEQTYSNEFNKIVIPENDEENDGLGLGLFSCPKPASDKDGFQVMGGIQGSTGKSNNNFSFLN